MPTLLNERAVVVDTPGVYVTRNGRKVVIHAVAPVQSPGCIEFRAKGAWYRTKGNRSVPQPTVWHVSGAMFIRDPHPLDIVRKISSHP